MVTFYLTTTNIYGHQSEPIIRKDSCNYNFTSSTFIYHDISTFLINPLSSTFHKFYFYLNSVQLMSIMDHFGYSTRPLVEYNLDLYTDRASFLGWLNHMSERKRLAITLDPASSEPTRFKNKRVQVSMEHSPSKEESEVEMTPVPQSLPSQPTTSHPLSAQKYPKGGKTITKSGKRKKGADSDVEYKPPSKPEKPKSRRSSSRMALPKPKPPPPNPIPVLMVIFLRILVGNALSTCIVLDRRFQTQRSLWRVRMLTMKVTVILLLTAKCQLLDLSSLIDLKIKIL